MKDPSANCSAKHSTKQQMSGSSSAVWAERYSMKRAVLLLACGLVLLLNGCQSGEPESSGQESEVTVTSLETSYAVITETTALCVSEKSTTMTEVTGTQTKQISSETQSTMQDIDAPIIESTAITEQSTTTEKTVLQLETHPDGDTSEEDAGDFGELFS